MDKAGGYGIQALGGMLVEYVHGDFLNVVGFPLNHFCKELARLYYPPRPEDLRRVRHDSIPTVDTFENLSDSEAGGSDPGQSAKGGRGGEQADGDRSQAPRALDAALDGADSRPPFPTGLLELMDGFKASKRGATLCPQSREVGLECRPCGRLWDPAALLAGQQVDGGPQDTSCLQGRPGLPMADHADQARVCWGSWSKCHPPPPKVLFTACKLKLFDVLKDQGPLQAVDVARKLSTCAGRTEQLLDVCAALGLLEKTRRGRGVPEGPLGAGPDGQPARKWEESGPPRTPQGSGEADPAGYGQMGPCLWAPARLNPCGWPLGASLLSRPSADGMRPTHVT
ncbi:N-acetylserotonin O-methyltransferase-like protein isoform X13 [Sagmatias obliquidens]|nr:N-acetylserotonin O-methyltransferase-like protein isoform X13 [Lagenorhynchus obliquidens]